jgi:hypothetical protein
MPTLRNSRTLQKQRTKATQSGTIGSQAVGSMFMSSATISDSAMNHGRTGRRMRDEEKVVCMVSPQSLRGGRFFLDFSIFSSGAPSTAAEGSGRGANASRAASTITSPKFSTPATGTQRMRAKE